MGRQESRRPGRTRRGFTLVELLVVMVIIGILLTVIARPAFRRVGEAKQTVAKQKVAALESKVMEFQIDCGRLPASQEGLQALVQPPGDVADRWKGPYVKEKDILDPWDRPLRYDCPGIHNQDFDIYTLGADDQEGGEGENADIGNW